jgi:hypothetical protein
LPAMRPLVESFVQPAEWVLTTSSTACQKLIAVGSLSPVPAAKELHGLGLLAVEDPVAAKVVELRHFAGLGHEAVAATLGVTVYQARQKWTYARAWLRKALEAGR